MRRLVIAAMVVGLPALTAAPAIADAPTTTEVTARLWVTSVGGLPAEEVELQPGDEPGSNWVSGDRIWHVRNLPASDLLVSLDGVTEIGHAERVFHFDLDLTDGSSTGRCAFTLVLSAPDLGTFMGHCAGSLEAGILTANAVNQFGHFNGTYQLEPGGELGIGPYLVQITVIHR